MTLNTGPIKPPFTEVSAQAKVQAAEDGLMQRRDMSANDIPISADDRQIRRAL